MQTVRRHVLASALLPSATPSAAVLLARGVLRAAWVTRLILVTALLTFGAVLAGGLTIFQTTAPTPSAQPEAKTSPAAKAAEAPPRRDLYGDPLPAGALVRMGTEQLRHPYAVGIAFADEGKTLISAGGQTVRFWDLATGKRKQSQQVPPEMTIVTLSPDGKRLALVQKEQLILWDVATNKETQRLKTDQTSFNTYSDTLWFSPDGKMFAATDVHNGVFRLWDIDSGKQRGPYKFEKVQKLAFSPDGKTLAVCGGERLALWDVAAGKEIQALTRPKDYVFSSMFSPDGKRLLCVAYRAIVLWEPATGKQDLLWEAEPDKGENNQVATFSPDGRQVAFRCKDQIILWDVAAKKEMKKLHGPSASGYDPHTHLRFSPDGKQLASLHQGASVLWDVATGRQIHERPGHLGATNSVAFSPDGKILASAAGGDATVRLWDAHTGKLLHTCSMGLGWINQLKFSPDGTHVFAGGLGGVLRECRMWDVRTGKEERIFRLPPVAKDQADQITALYLSPDGKRLTALSLWNHINDKVRTFRRYLTTWDVATGEQVERRALAYGDRIQMDLDNFSPDGKLVTTMDEAARGGGFMIYDVVADRPLRRGLPGGFAPPVFSPDGKVIAYGGYSAPTQLADVATGGNLLTIPMDEQISKRAFTRDGRYLVTAGQKGLLLFELASGKQVLHHPDNGTTSLAIAPDGRSAATGLVDTTILVWDLAPATRQKIELSAADLERLWTDLAGDDAPRAYRAIGTLIADPQRSVPFLREHLQPVKEDAPRIRRLVADLDSDQFAVRDAAYKELEKMDDAAHGVLRQALKDAKSLELRRRIETLLSDPWVVQSPRKLRQIRAIAVLEQIGNAEARRVLEHLASGVAEARLTREAKAALKRQ
jgi:WD40 repeat protein